MATLKVRRDYPTIQAAVDAAQPGDCILVENGVYYEEVSITKSDLRIVGGKCATVSGDFTRGSCFLLDGASRVSIESFSLKNCTGNCVAISGGGENTLCDCRISECFGNGVYADATSLPRLINCGIAACGENGTYLLNCDGGQINGCRVESCSNGIYIDQDLPRLFEITGCEISRNFASGLLAGDSPVTVRDCCFAANADTAVLLTGAGSVLECNTVSNNFSDGIATDASNCVFTDNQVLANEKTGITVGSDCRVLGNVCARNGVDGILLEGSGNVVEGNQCIDNTRFDIARLLPQNIIRNNLYRSSNPRRIGEPSCPG